MSEEKEKKKRKLPGKRDRSHTSLHVVMWAGGTNCKKTDKVS